MLPCFRVNKVGLKTKVYLGWGRGGETDLAVETTSLVNSWMTSRLETFLSIIRKAVVHHEESGMFLIARTNRPDC